MRYPICFGGGKYELNSKYKDRESEKTKKKDQAYATNLVEDILKQEKSRKGQGEQLETGKDKDNTSTEEEFLAKITQCVVEYKIDSESTQKVRPDVPTQDIIPQKREQFIQ